MEKGVVSRNVAKLVKFAKADEPERQPFTPEQIAADLYAHVQPSMIKVSAEPNARA